ncbi:MAG: hypothetical protein WCQ72_02395, partial [Eubacteriales bacterium]
KAHRSKGKRESLRGRKTVGLSVLSGSSLVSQTKNHRKSRPSSLATHYANEKSSKKPSAQLSNPFRKRKIIENPSAQLSNPLRKRKIIKKPFSQVYHSLNPTV